MTRYRRKQNRGPTLKTKIGNNQSYKWAQQREHMVDVSSSFLKGDHSAT